MKVLILNSGLGSRMGDETKTHPKCMTSLTDSETILSRQLDLLYENGLKDVVITTGPFEDKLIDYVNSLNLDLNIKFVNNSKYKETNYIYSIYKAKEELNDDIILMHGDLVFSDEVLKMVMESKNSVMTVSSTLDLPEKDFKAVIKDNKIVKVGIEFFDNALACQPLYKLNKEDWLVWLENIERFIESGNNKCYAENAFNEISDKVNIYPLDIENMLCGEIDNLEDLKVMKKKLWRM